MFDSSSTLIKSDIFFQEEEAPKKYGKNHDIAKYFKKKEFQNLTMLSNQEFYSLIRKFEGPQLSALCLRRKKCHAILENSIKLKKYIERERYKLHLNKNLVFWWKNVMHVLIQNKIII